MPTYSKEFLSGGTGDGLGLKITPTATAGTTVHAAHATAKDEIYIYAFNTHTSDVTLTLEWGDVTAPDDLIEHVVPATDGLHLITPGLILTNKTIGAFASVADVIIIYGFVNRIT
jgi:hypothetical protein